MAHYYRIAKHDVRPIFKQKTSTRYWPQHQSKFPCIEVAGNTPQTDAAKVQLMFHLGSWCSKENLRFPKAERGFLQKNLSFLKEKQGKALISSRKLMSSQGKAMISLEKHKFS